MGAREVVRRFEFDEGASSKFWELGVAGNAVTIRWGRIGTAGQAKTFASALAASKRGLLS